MAEKLDLDALERVAAIDPSMITRGELTALIARIRELERAQHAGEARETVAWIRAADLKWLETTPDVGASVRVYRKPSSGKVAIYAAPQPAALPEGWQPIETAPKDGTEILLTNGKTVAEGQWCDEEPYIREYRDADGRWIDQQESDGFEGWMDWSGGMKPGPSHWMPLPPAPAMSASKEGA